MLYISRKNGESIMIGDSIKITIVEIKGNRTKLGIEHPAGSRILRQELYDRTCQENHQAHLSAQMIEDLWK